MPAKILKNCLSLSLIIISIFPVHHRMHSSPKKDEKNVLERARKLTLRDSDDMQREWTLASDEQLAGEIETYRSAIQSMLELLQEKEKKQEVNRGQICDDMVEEMNPEEWQIPPHSIPILAEVTSYDWKSLAQCCQFDVIMMDPPWQLATSNPTRGVALGYHQLSEKDILNLPITSLQTEGLLFIWVINSSFDFAVRLFTNWGYQIIDEIVWAKLTVNRRLAKSHGYYLQHAKETCLVGMKGKGIPKIQSKDALSDVLLSQRRGQSQKPNEIYDLIEGLVPQGKYLEIFARKNNLRDFWVSIGDEVIGAVQQNNTKLRRKQTSTTT